MAIGGKYYSATITTTTADEDLMADIKTAVGEKAVARKLTLITSDSITISINGDALVYEFDIHYESDTIGSRTGIAK